MADPQDALTPDTTKREEVKRRTSNEGLLVPGPLNTVVKLTMGQLFYRDASGEAKHCLFQFNPPERGGWRNTASPGSERGIPARSRAWARATAPSASRRESPSPGRCR